MFDRILAMAYGAVGDWCNHLKKDWKRGKRFVPIIEILVAIGTSMLFLVGVWQGVLYLLPTQSTPTTNGDQSPVFIGNATVTDSFNKTIVNDYDPVFEYRLDEEKSGWKDGQYHSTYVLELKTKLPLGIEQVGVTNYLEYCKELIGGTGFSTNEPHGRLHSLEWTIECDTPSPISDNGNLFDYEIFEN